MSQLFTQHRGAADERRWRVPEGVERLGPSLGSGLRDATYLVRRRDGQVVQLSELLHLVVQHVDPALTPSEICDAVSRSYDRSLTPDGLTFLVEARLQPLGLVEPDDSTGPPPSPRARPLLALTFRAVLLPAPTTRRLGRLLAPAFWPPMVVLVLLALMTLDVHLVRTADPMAMVTPLVETPLLFMVVFLLVNLGAVVHEVGHAAACRYGGAEPGNIGVGVYIVFPAYYTDVTASYALSRAGRLRTDLGGLYFHVLFVLGVGLGYLVTGHGILLAIIALTQLQMLQQLVPVVRFDGYYVLADLAGVPDLFARVGPVLRSLVPGSPMDPMVSSLRPHARRIVTGWVLVVVPTLALAVGWLIWHMPLFLDQLVRGYQLQLATLRIAWPRDEYILIAVAVLSLLLLTLPALGIAVLVWRLGAAVASVLLRATGRHRTEEAQMPAPSQSAPQEFTPGELSAAAFNDADMLPRAPAVPTLGWRRAVYEVSGHTVTPRPGAEQRRREELERRLRNPIAGCRRVVVMSRKGGVGKTTITLALGSTFATLRGDRVVAVDANPDAGNLAHRVASPNDRTITDVLRDLDSIESYAQLRSYTSQASESRLEVLASDDDPRIGMALDRVDYHRLIGLLDRFYNLILLDTGTGILDSANQGLLQEADQLVLVLRAGLDGGRAAALTLDWLDEHGYDELVRHAVVVLNSVRSGVGAPLDPMVRHFELRCDRVVPVPWDKALEVGAQTRLSGLHRDTRQALVEMSAAVADRFVQAGARP